MADYNLLSTLISPFITQFKPESVLIVGETAQNCYQKESNIALQTLNYPFNHQQLVNLSPVDLAIISDITDNLTKIDAIECLGTLRNSHAAHIIVISDIALSTQQGWQLSDYLSLGMTLIEKTPSHQVFSYAIENYQRKKEWLNSKFWANPELFDKYRW